MSNHLDEWLALKPVYFPRWVWNEISERQPEKYGKKYPVYQGCKVILT